MRKILLITLLIIICKGSSFASHIVGGEFELVYLNDTQYRLNLIIYFDEINGEAGAKYTPLPSVWIFRKSDNAVMRQQIELPFFSEQLVEYTVPKCAIGSPVKTSKLIFSRIITLNPQDYDDPKGYYIVWQRCCRNYNIKNIISEDPTNGGIGAGQTFYLEIPPLYRNGERFINTSPQLFPPLSDYGCVNRPYYADFTGVDADGDSLVYSIVDPYNTPSATPHPQPPSTAPYPTIIWENTFGLNDIVHGDPDLYISNEGLLRVTPTESGIFVFAVKCEEFRDGEKIGEVRRDFQMVVVDCPPPGEKPDLSLELEDGSTYSEGQVLHFEADDSKCVKFTVEDNKGGRVNYKLKPVGYAEQNFTVDILEISPSGDRLTAEVCFSDCPPEEDAAFNVDFIGLDDTCPQPLQDTLRMTVLITPPSNDLPELKHKEDTDVSYSLSNRREITVKEQAGGIKILELLGFDGNRDFMDFMIEPVGFELADYGMSVQDQFNLAGRRSVWLVWNYDCTVVDFDGKTSFDINIYLEDLDDCLYDHPVLLQVKLDIELPSNSLPEIFSNKLGQTNADVVVEAELNEVVTFDVRGKDDDGDFCVISATPVGFNFSDYGISYAGVSGMGSPTLLNSTFSWNLECSLFDLDKQDTYRILFLIEDQDKCRITSKDTLTVDFALSPPPNAAPLLNVTSVGDQAIESDTIHMIIDESVRLKAIGRDFDNDSLRLFIIDDRSEELGYLFESKLGAGYVESDFVWDPECYVLQGQPEIYIPVEFAVQDMHCTDPVLNTRKIVLHIKDIDNKSEQFVPPNLFTPNGDGFNPYFGMYRISGETGIEENILPLDNCAGQFENVSIYNRWGKEVFFSRDRYFKWYGEGVASGVYFYNISYTNRTYRGALTLKF